MLIIRRSKLYYTRTCTLSWSIAKIILRRMVSKTSKLLVMSYLVSLFHIYIKVKVKWSRCRLGVAQRVGRGIALLFHDCGTRRGWVVSSMLRPHFTPGKDPVPILQEAGWAPGPVWMGGKSHPHQDSIPDRPARSSVAIPTELPGPYIYIYTLRGNKLFTNCKKFTRCDWLLAVLREPPQCLPQW